MGRKYLNPILKRTKQSEFTKYNLYDLDSDNDELDFLDKQIDMDKRNQEKK